MKIINNSKGENIMLEQIKSTIKDPQFQRKAAQAAGSVVSFVATIAISNLVSKAVEVGIDAIMDKIQSTENSAE